MPLLIQSNQALNEAQIIEHLRQLRQHALVESSHFAVAALLQIQQADGGFIYVGGVNVEHADHNRLGMHAEQNAIVTAQSLLGGRIVCAQAWVMGAPDGIQAGDENPLAENFVQPCGHCRQILLSFSNEDTSIFSVTVNGTVGAPKKIVDFLPQAFSERDVMSEPVAAEAVDLGIDEASSFLDSSMRGASVHGARSTPPLWKMQQQTIELNESNLRARMALATPHVIAEGFLTSEIQVCTLKVMRDTTPHYLTGVLVQDIAFLTTDAVYAAIGQAITSFGGHDLHIDEIHLFGQNLDQMVLNGSELSHLSRFSSAETIVQFHTKGASSQLFTLRECIDHYARCLLCTLEGEKRMQAVV